MPVAISPPSRDIDTIGLRLAEARKTGIVASDVNLAGLIDLETAGHICDAALRHLRWTQIGYSLVGTTALTARLLRLPDPVVAPLLREAVLEDGSTFRQPQGVIGAGVGFTFLLGRAYPFCDDEVPTMANAASACAGCRLDLHLLGRRAPLPALLDERSVTADLGLDVVHVAGSWIEAWTSLDLAATEVSLAIDGNVVARGRGRDLRGDPLAAVAWLARLLAGQGSGLNAGDLVVVGSCTGLSQVLPGQTLLARFGDLATVSLGLG